jgi:hypothetical protein
VVKNLAVGIFQNSKTWQFFYTRFIFRSENGVVKSLSIYIIERPEAGLYRHCRFALNIRSTIGKVEKRPERDPDRC